MEYTWLVARAQIVNAKFEINPDPLIFEVHQKDGNKCITAGKLIWTFPNTHPTRQKEHNIQVLATAIKSNLWQIYEKSPLWNLQKKQNSEHKSLWLKNLPRCTYRWRHCLFVYRLWHKEQTENREKLMEQNHLIIDLTCSRHYKHALRHDSVFEKRSPFQQPEDSAQSLGSYRAHSSSHRLKGSSLPHVRGVWLHLRQPQRGSPSSSAPLFALEMLQLQHLSAGWH